MNLSKPYIKIFLLVLLAFVFSANRAWYFNRPEFTIKTHEKIPLFWQYDMDSHMEFLSAAHFPDQFKTSPVRVTRPGYPMMVKAIAITLQTVSSPVYRMDTVTSAFLAYVLLKLMVFLLGAFLSFRLLTRYFGEDASFLAVVFLMFQNLSLIFMSTFHTKEMQFITPVIILYLLALLCGRYSHARNVLFSFIAGFLMLIRPTAGTYLAVIAFTFFYLRRRKETLISAGAFVLPAMGWFVFMRFYGLEFYSPELEKHGQLVWILEMANHSFLANVQTILRMSQQWIEALTAYYGIFLLLAAGCAFSPGFRSDFPRRETVLIGYCVAANWLFVLATGWLRPSMTSDLCIIIFPLAAVLIRDGLKNIGRENWLKWAAVLYIACSFLMMMKFPFVHPYDQTDTLSAQYTKLTPEDLNTLKVNSERLWEELIGKKYIYDNGFVGSRFKDLEGPEEFDLPGYSAEERAKIYQFIDRKVKQKES